MTAGIKMVVKMTMLMLLPARARGGLAVWLLLCVAGVVLVAQAGAKHSMTVEEVKSRCGVFGVCLF